MRLETAGWRLETAGWRLETACGRTDDDRGISLFLQTPAPRLQPHNAVIRSRKRFTRELRRLSECNAACVVVEADLQDILGGRYRSRTHPNVVLPSSITERCDQRPERATRAPIRGTAGLGNLAFTRRAVSVRECLRSRAPRFRAGMAYDHWRPSYTGSESSDARRQPGKSASVPAWRCIPDPRAA